MVALFLQVFRSIDSGSVKGFPTEADEVRTQVISITQEAIRLTSVLLLHILDIVL